MRRRLHDRIRRRPDLFGRLISLVPAYLGAQIAQIRHRDPVVTADVDTAKQGELPLPAARIRHGSKRSEKMNRPGAMSWYSNSGRSSALDWQLSVAV